VAPGTAGSLVGLALFWLLSGTAAGVQAASLAVVFFVGVAASTDVARRLGAHDPGRVVVDEVAGVWATLLFLPWSAATAVLGFVLFRVMDVVKPYPARELESLPRGWGIMADDIMAGVYANLTLRLIRLAWPLP
jgi:phosphatidylglycerophosphatase A